MSGVFDRLNKKLIEAEEAQEGISVLHLRDLPPPLRILMRLMLREVELPESALREAMAAMPDKEQMSDADLDEALDILTKQMWLIRMGEDDRITYKVNLRAKPGMTGIWGSLNNLISQPPGDSPE